jgi:hypothetical protein
MSPNTIENVLQGVPPLRFWGEGAVGWYCLAGAVTRYLEFIRDPVPYAEVMGVSGAAWRLIWDEGQWSPDNLIMAWYGHSLAEKRIADAFGYRYAFLDSDETSEEAITARIRAEIDAGRPAIAIGIAGPEECLVAGYREGGVVLLVQSFFERTDGYLEVRDWYDQPQFLGLHLLAKTGERKSECQNLIEALTWAVEMAAMTEAGGRAAGLAAYDAWAKDMLRDEDFRGDDLDRIGENCLGIGDNGIILLCARKVAAEYLEMMQDAVGSQARTHLLAAAELHRRESETMGAAHDIMPWGNVRGDELLKRVERANREALAEVIRQCKGYFAQAMGEIRKALGAEGVDVERA